MYSFVIRIDIAAIHTVQTAFCLVSFVQLVIFSLLSLGLAMEDGGSPDQLIPAVDHYNSFSLLSLDYPVILTIILDVYGMIHMYYIVVKVGVVSEDCSDIEMYGRAPVIV